MLRPGLARGFTLIEMMVSLVIGFAVVGALLAAYMASFQSGRHNDAMVQVTEDATLALSVMRQQVAQAGFSTAQGATDSGLVVHTFPAILGCAQANFRDLQTTVLTPSSCGTSAAVGTAPDAVEIAFEASVLPGGSSNSILGGTSGSDPLDCLGNSFARTHDAAHGDYFLNDSKFYVASGTLYCHGPGNAAGAAVAQNVESLQVRYGVKGVDADGADTGQIAYYAPAPPIGAADWSRVVAVSLCVQVRSVAKVIDTASIATLGGYVDCGNVRRTSTDGYLRRTFSTTVALRNRLP
jgi:type IV pilus assembly protein PilW